MAVELAVESDTSVQLRELFAICTRLRNQLANAPLDRREKLKPQVDNLHDEYQDLQNAYKSHLDKRAQTVRLLPCCRAEPLLHVIQAAADWLVIS